MPVARPASQRQVEYVASLLARRVRDGEGGGYMTVGHLMRDGQIDRAAIARMSSSEASAMIDNLRGQY